MRNKLLSLLLVGSMVLPSTVGASFEVDLGVGSSGEDVKELQIFLAEDSIIYPEALVTGFFGKLTEQAVIRFQRKNGLEQVGRVGPKTRELLNKSLPIHAIDEFASYVPQIFEISTSTRLDSGYVFWTTNKATRSTFWYSNNTPVNPTVANKIEDNSFSGTHSVNLTGLSPSTTYYYLIKIFDSKGNSATSTEMTLQTLNQ